MRRLTSYATAPADESSPTYHGWWVVVGCSLIALFICGFGLYGQGIYLAELQRAHGWQTAQLSAASTLSLLVSSVLVAFTSDLMVWMGLRSLLLCGTSSLAASTTILALMTHPWQLYLAFLLMALGSTCMGTVVVAIVVNSWFEQRRGLALSLALNGATCGGVILVPALLALVGTIGFTLAMLAATATILVVLVPVVLALSGRRTQERLEQYFARADYHEGIGQAPTSPSRRALLRMIGFWTIAVPFAIALLAGVGLIVHQVPFLEPIIGRSAAGFAVTITASMAVVGRICLGAFVDRVDPRSASAAFMIIQAAALVIVLQTSNPTVLLFAFGLYGFSIGHLTTLPSLIIQREIGPAAFGTALGLSTAIGGIGSAFGPGLLGLIRSLTGGYAAALVLCLVLTITAASLVLLREP
ncbi:MFS transporter [Bradyrhizobium sp. Pear76]|uniref:MFS transporter n=1 Tax=Bradyrhizobium oropedii TaxID=1571201 RepID=UPI001E5CDDAF|nr:MFS transporter [Bradyrhizobium oropedii]MCC8962449.1 MFS transporter [Bradyrhizobium oropedii]